MSVIYGGLDAFDSLLYPNQHPNNDRFIQSQFNENITTSLNDVGRTFISKAKETYERLKSSEVMRVAKAALNQASGLFMPNKIMEIRTIEQMQVAQPIMQRWIMAEPQIRQMYNDKLCHGYADTYFDINPGTVAETDYNYRAVMDGVIVDQKDGSWKAKSYGQDLIEDDEPLTVFDQFTILKVWDNAKLFMATGIDPTDPWNGKLS